MSQHDPRPDQPAPDQPDVPAAAEAAAGAPQGGATVTDAGAAAPRRKHRRVVRRGTETAEVSGISADERGEGWSEGPARENDDAHLLRDLPPHWGGAGYRD
ncbi:hypothetical protein ATL41_2232 [Flavimobilis soli]|uniref:Uncharacterized protein n=1 Tax=Flavimobilis soli TaxID=442709 RepID=A0A2A9EEW7_9MICO|nr:hypothetical protein [Flavimobilis soli]PFG37468.1 hypothetical protein ATL41_2232 [Flavimobilis soli]